VQTWPEIEGLNKGGLKMRKGWLIFFWLLTIIIVSILLIFIKANGKTSNIIQAIALITLVFVTWIYARQTQELVQQEKISLFEETKKRHADFCEKNLQEFYMPLQYRLNNLNLLFKESSNLSELQCFSDYAKENYKVITDVLEKYGYLAHQDFGKSIDKLTQLFESAFDLSSDRPQEFDSLKGYTRSLLEDMRIMITKQIKENLKIVNEYYKRDGSDENISK